MIAVAAAAPARAQQSAPLLPEDPRAPRFDEVEHGWFSGFETGWLLLLRTPTADRAKFPFAGTGGGSAGGLLVGAHVGLELGDRLAVALFASGANLQAGRAYGAVGLFATGADARFTFLSRRDRHGVERLRAYAHVRGGWVLTRPTGLLGDDDLLVAGGPGVEYFTRLRHFSIGIAADGVWLARAAVPGVTILPTVRYTF